MAKKMDRARSFSVEVPKDYVLPRDVCSYGYFLLAPHHWSVEGRSLRTTLDLAGAEVMYRAPQASVKTPAVTVMITQKNDAAAGAELAVSPDRALAKEEREIVRGMLARMLRLDEPAETIAEFHGRDPRWAGKRKGRAGGGGGGQVTVDWRMGRGRLFRSPTFFEDVIKTVTSCNVTWPSTIIMNTRLSEIAGAKSVSGFSAFPTPERLAKTRATTLRAQCSVGYRDERIVELSRMFAGGRRAIARFQAGDTRAEVKEGDINPLFFETTEGEGGADDETLFELLQEWPGIGPYAAANILQLLGRYSRLPLDTESVRHGRAEMGMTGTSASIMKRLHAHYEPFGSHKFRSYWFELWDGYEAKRGPSWDWDRETTGKTFTAKLLKEIAKEGAKDAKEKVVKKKAGRK